MAQDKVTPEIEEAEFITLEFDDGAEESSNADDNCVNDFDIGCLYTKYPLFYELEIGLSGFKRPGYVRICGNGASGEPIWAWGI